MQEITNYEELFGEEKGTLNGNKKPYIHHGLKIKDNHLTKRISIQESLYKPPSHPLKLNSVGIDPPAATICCSICIKNP